MTLFSAWVFLCSTRIVLCALSLVLPSVSFGAVLYGARTVLHCGSLRSLFPAVRRSYSKPHLC